jgi:hypothetical protein
VTIEQLVRWQPKTPCDAIARFIWIAALVAHEVETKH